MRRYKVPAYFLIRANSPEEAYRVAKSFSRDVQLLTAREDDTFYVDGTHAPEEHFEEDDADAHDSE